MKRMAIVVTLEVSNPTTAEDRANITENVLEALKSHVICSEGGLVGDEFDGYTTEIEVGSDELTQIWDVDTNTTRTV